MKSPVAFREQVAGLIADSSQVRVDLVLDESMPQISQHSSRFTPRSGCGRIRCRTTASLT